MKILRKTSKGIRPEFWGWSSYTQQACESGMFSLSFFSFFVVRRQVFKHTLIMTYSVFTEEKKTLKSHKFIPPMHQFCKLNIFRALLSENRVCMVVGVETLLLLCSYSIHFSSDSWILLVYHKIEQHCTS